VAIPSYFFYRFFRGMVAEYVISMEEKAISLFDCIERGNLSPASHSSYED
jgi:biopolymer transport protein ExbB